MDLMEVFGGSSDIHLSSSIDVSKLVTSCASLQLPK